MATYSIDPMHSEISFKVKHLMITTVTGLFTKFSASMTSEKDDFSDAAITFEADINSISTNNEQRDGHLKSDDFFNAAQFPTMRFVSTGLSKKNDSEYALTGNLTIRDKTHTVSLTAHYAGTVTDPYGQTKVGFEIEGKINRKDFGLMWSATTEAGGVVVSDEVRLQINVQMVKGA
ncbi:MAG: YceI family protein [Candidatus Kapabacteria bacterium]|jgi:polyisoprenoid-binding protein YceI|nr:YceI family protein [Candidatus Kapabacteria bacterium]